METITLDEARKRFGELQHRATRTYREFDDPGRSQLVSLYLERVGFSIIEARAVIADGRRGDPLYAVIGGTDR